MRAVFQRWMAIDIIVAVTVLLVLIAALLGHYNFLVSVAEDQTVASTFAVGERDALLFSEFWQQIEDHVGRLQTLSRSVMLDARNNDGHVQQKQLNDLQFAVSVASQDVAEVVGTNSLGHMIWSTNAALTERLPSDLTGLIQPILKGQRETFVDVDRDAPAEGPRRLYFSRAERDTNGVLLGISIVVLDAARAESIASTLVRHTNDVVSLLRDHSTAILRSDENNLGSGDPTVIPSDQMDDHGFFISRGPERVGGVPRLSVLRDVPSSSLSVLICVDEMAALGAVRSYERRLRTTTIAIGVMLVLLIISAVLARRQAMHIEAAKLAVVAFQARGQLLHEISDRSLDMIGVVDHELRYVFCNKVGAALYGVTPAEMVGRPSGGLLLPEFRDAVLTKLHSLTGSDQSTRYIAPLQPAQGAVVWLEFELCQINLPNQDGTAQTGWFFIGRDVTDRHHAEQALDSAHQNLRFVTENVPGVLYRSVTAKDGPTRLEYVSTKDQMMLGFEPAVWQLPGFIQSRIHPDDLAERQAFLDRLNGLPTSIREYRIRHRDGHYIWMRDHGTAYRNDDGTFSISGYGHDITQEKEQARKLDEARRMLSLGELASGVGHELGQPLMSINLAADLGLHMLRTVPADIGLAAQKFERVIALVQRAGTIIDTMRSLGRREINVMAWTRLPETAVDAVATIRDRLTLEGVTIRLDLPPTLPPVWISPLLFEQVLINLISNACDAYRDAPGFRRNGSVIHVEAWAHAQQVVLRVRDEAGGVPEEVMGRLFEPFFTTKHAGRGSGLGLSVCYGVIRQAQGNLSVHNDAKGAVFEIALPDFSEAYAAQTEPQLL